VKADSTSLLTASSCSFRAASFIRAEAFSRSSLLLHVKDGRPDPCRWIALSLARIQEVPSILNRATWRERSACTGTACPVSHRPRRAITPMAYTRIHGMQSQVSVGCTYVASAEALHRPSPGAPCQCARSVASLALVVAGMACCCHRHILVPRKQCCRVLDLGSECTEYSFPRFLQRCCTGQTIQKHALHSALHLRVLLLAPSQAGSCTQLLQHENDFLHENLQENTVKSGKAAHLWAFNTNVACSPAPQSRSCRSLMARLIGGVLGPPRGTYPRAPAIVAGLSVVLRA
jgi:hypothetical protein